jgi:hypothetical protein
MDYELTDNEKESLAKSVNAVLSIPFIDDLEDFIWEAVFCYVKGLPLTDPLVSIRSKRLFDIVSEEKGIGWSAKAVQWPIHPPCQFELVIQRADIFKKSKELGFATLDINTAPEILGNALLKHWLIEKVAKDAQFQNVSDKRVCILMKARNRKKFAYFEESIAEYSPDDIEWRWTDSSKTGLQGTRKQDGFLVYRWYPNQKQLFERFMLPSNAFVFSLDPRRISMQDTVEILSKYLGNI